MTPEEYIQACRECSSGERAMELLRSAENIVTENEKLLEAGRKMKAIIDRSRRYVDERIIDYSEQVKTLTKQVRSLEEQNKTLSEQVGELEAVIEDNRIELMQLGSLSDCIERLAAVTVRLEKTDKPAEKPKKTASKKSSKPEESFKKYGEYRHVMLTDKQYEKLKADFGGKADEYIQKVDEYCQQVGKTYKDYNLTVRKFIRDDRGGGKNAVQLVNVGGKEYEFKNGRYYIPNGSGIAVDPHAENDLDGIL